MKKIFTVIFVIGILFCAMRMVDAMEPKENKPAETLCIAHRGGAAYAPENTLAALNNAIKIGADYSEVDVHLSSDGHVVVIHDDLLERTTDGEGLVKDMTVARLKELDAGSWFSEEFKGEKIPTLEEVLDTAKGKIGVVIEIKNGPYFYEGIEQKVIDLVEEKNMEKDVIIISFDHECIKTVNSIAPFIATGVLYYANILDVEELKEDTGAEYICPGWALATQKALKDCHEEKIKMNIWTVNDEKVMKKFIDLKVDAITTDKPDVLLKALGRECK